MFSNIHGTNVNIGVFFCECRRLVTAEYHQDVSISQTAQEFYAIIIISVIRHCESVTRQYQPDLEYES